MHTLRTSTLTHDTTIDEHTPSIAYTHNKRNTPDHSSGRHQESPASHRRVERHQVCLHELTRMGRQQGHEPGRLSERILLQQLQAQRVLVHRWSAGSTTPLVVGRALLAATISSRVGVCFLAGGAVGCFLGERSVTRNLISSGM